MRGTLAVLVVSAALALHGCGDTCSTAPADLQSFTGGGCTVPAGMPFTLVANGACQQCSDSSPSCSTDLAGTSTIELDTVYQQCQSNAGCAGSSCVSPPPVFGCTVQGLPAGTYSVLGKTSGGTTSETVTVVAQGGSATCAL